MTSTGGALSALARLADRSLALPIGAAIAFVWANVDHASYRSFANALEFSVNDIGMVFFFGLAVKEVVEATVPGAALHTWRRAALPVAAAVGGMIAPAVIYIGYATASGHPAIVRGWAIPCATDIAFSYLVAKAIFRDHPAIPFLLLLSIADDAFGLVVLAVFYPVHELQLPIAAGVMAVAVATAFVLRRRGVTIFWPYVLLGGAISWYALYRGGLHPALALVPIVPFMPHAARDAGLFVDAQPGATDTLSAFGRWWKPPVEAILFLFGLVNAGVEVTAAGPGTWAVLTAIVLGKPLGIGLSIAAATALGLTLPPRFGWREVMVIGCIAGIGFTVSLFFATAAFLPGPALDQAKLGALLSVGSAGVAFAVARLTGRARAG